MVFGTSHEVASPSPSHSTALCLSFLLYKKGKTRALTPWGTGGPRERILKVTIDRGSWWCFVCCSF